MKRSKKDSNEKLANEAEIADCLKRILEFLAKKKKEDLLGIINILLTGICRKLQK